MSTTGSEQRAQGAGQAIGHAVLDATAVHALQLELKDFTSQTMHRLQSLSQSLRQCQQMQPTLIQENRQCIVQNEIARLTDVNSEPASANQRDGESRHESQICSADEPRAIDDGVDPMERLNAIKQRLEQQMQSTL